MSINSENTFIGPSTIKVVHRRYSLRLCLILTWHHHRGTYVALTVESGLNFVVLLPVLFYKRNNSTR